MRILIGSGEDSAERALAVVSWTEEDGLTITGPEAKTVRTLIEREYRQWYDASAGGLFVTLTDEELVLSLPYRLPRSQWWAVELTITGERLPQVPYDPNGTIWRQLNRADRAAAIRAALALVRDQYHDPNSSVVLTWIEGEDTNAIYHFVGLAPAVAGSLHIAAYQVRTGAWHAVFEGDGGDTGRHGWSVTT
jgi:hypothetical protein